MGTLKHVIHFHQMRFGKERSVGLILLENYQFTPRPTAEGNWYQGAVPMYTGDDVKLYEHAPPSEKELLWWKYNKEGFEIQVGKWNDRASHKKGEEKYFNKWITLSDAKRHVNGWFYIPSLTAPAKYEHHGSSNGFTKSEPASWQIIKYD